MIHHNTITRLAASVCLSLLTLPAWAFDSGSNGSDGILAPTEDVTITLPGDGILHYQSINIPTGVTVTFRDDSQIQGNPPAQILVQENASIIGDINIEGRDGNTVGSNFNLAPGSFRGGSFSVFGRGLPGEGPGGGGGGVIVPINADTVVNFSGSGGSYGSLGETNARSYTGPTYGSVTLQPLLGGSGGGSPGRHPDNSLITRITGGGGGGAILLAVSGRLFLSGNILANGGDGAGSTRGRSGGGSGGGVRLVASELSGRGSIDVNGGTVLFSTSNGGHGRVRLEADTFNFTGTILPGNQALSIALPQPAILTNIPTVRISSIAGNAVPANPTGFNDIALPSDITNPVTVEFATTQVPAGSTIELTIVTSGSNPIVVTSDTLSGDLNNATASAEVSLPEGNSTLTASVNFRITPATAALYAPFAEGEQVAEVTLHGSVGGTAGMTLVTESGRIIEVPNYASL